MLTIIVNSLEGDRSLDEEKYQKISKKTQFEIISSLVSNNTFCEKIFMNKTWERKY